MASDPPRVVHLITRAQGGLHDYQAFLHEAGHALHFAGVDPSLPISFRRLAREQRADRDLLVHRRGDLPRARVARPPLRPVGRAGRRECRGEPSSSRRSSSAGYEAKLRFESDFWGTASTEAGEVAPRATRSASPPRPASGTAQSGYLSDMDPGFYSADYLRAWIRSAQLHRYLIDTIGPDWWHHPATGQFLSGLLGRHEALVGGDRGPYRLRPIRHRSAAPRDRSLRR